MIEGLDAFESPFITSYENRLTTKMAPKKHMRSRGKYLDFKSWYYLYTSKNIEGCRIFFLAFLLYCYIFRKIKLLHCLEMKKIYEN